MEKSIFNNRKEMELNKIKSTTYKNFNNRGKEC